MATAINLPTFSEFELQLRDRAPTLFEKYVECLNDMFAAMSITQASKKKAMLLHYVGEETYDVFETLTVPALTGEGDEYRTAVKAFVDYFEPHKCVDHHVYIFRQESQKSIISPSSIFVFNCWHANVSSPIYTDLEIKRQIIQGKPAGRPGRKAIGKNLNLVGLLKAAR